MAIELEKAALKGDIRSQYELGLLYEKQKDYEPALRWFKEAAKQGAALYEQAKLAGVSAETLVKGLKSGSSKDNFVRIKGGLFMMGSPLSEPERQDNEAQHYVKLESFLIGKYQVTQQEYEKVTGMNPSHFKGDLLPVEEISWYEAVEYCNKRSIQEGLTPVYRINKGISDSNNTNSFDKNKWVVNLLENSTGYRLPTEAEWEYACRAGTTTPYGTGNNITLEQANYGGKGVNSSQSTLKVGSFAANPWGLYDMHGNVFEWCWDWYGVYSNATQTDPTGAVSGTHRVLRGGSWNKTVHNMRSAYRIGSTPSLKSSEFGLRLAKNG